MARLNKEQVIGMLFDEDFDSGGESEIEEDLAFPLPMAEETGYTPSPQQIQAESPAISSDEDQCETENQLENLSQNRESGDRERQGREEERSVRRVTRRGKAGSARGAGSRRGRAGVTGTGGGRTTGRQSSIRDRSPHAQGKVFIPNNYSHP